MADIRDWPPFSNKKRDEKSLALIPEKEGVPFW
jgi:hypothetical protein